MERILRGEKSVEVRALFQQIFDYKAPVVLFPVRHHSPVCAKHLRRVIADYQPEVILIEGPQNAQELIEDIGKEGNKPPFCIYLSYDDTKGLLGEEGGKYRAYYPLLDYSPELNGIKAAKKANIPCEFIDLPYHEKLYNREALQATLQEGEEADRLFTLSDYYKRLCEKTGCRNFNELWEKLFEIQGLNEETQAFVESLFTYCYYSRVATPEEEFLKAGDLAREQYMGERIEAAKQKYNKVLVVTGGMHTVALAKHCTESPKGMEEVKVKHMPEEMPKTYLMPYSFEASDQNKGYEAGMVFPYFYQKVWERMDKNKKDPYEEAILSFIMSVAGKMRKKQAISITDEMQSFYMAKGLAELREKPFAGVFELIDAVKSAFVKGEYNLRYEPVVDALHNLLTGLEMGCISDTQNIPPIVIDFLEQCKKYGIQTKTSLEKETKLDSYQKEQHRQKSYFFHRMLYLGTGFCTYEKGQEDRSGIGRILLRESWRYRYSPKVQAVLIDQSVYGGSIREACLYLLTKAIKGEHHTASSLSTQLILAEKMGMDELYEQLATTLKEVIGEDMSFVSIAEGFGNLSLIAEKMQLRQRRESQGFKSLQALALYRMKVLVPTIMAAPKDEENELCEKFKFVYECLMNEQTQEESSLLEEVHYLEALEDLFHESTANSALVGAAGGILLKSEEMPLEQVMDKLEWYLRGSQKAKKQSAAFLKGFFKMAKDTLFIEPKLLLLIDEILRETSGEDFLEILPDLRLAFTYFLPFEIDKIAHQVAGYYQTSSQSILEGKAIATHERSLVKEADEASYSLLMSWFSKLVTMQKEEDKQLATSKQPISREADELSSSRDIEVATLSEEAGTTLVDAGTEAIREDKRRETQINEAYDKEEQLNKWRLVLGSFAEEEIALKEGYEGIDETLEFLYNREYSKEQGIREKEEDKKGGRGSSRLTVPEWLHKVRKLFPSNTVELMQKQALEQYHMTELLMDEQILKKMQPDMGLLKNILSFKNQMSGEVVATARKIVEEVVRELEKQLQKEIDATFQGKKNPYKSSQVRTMRNFDFKKTIRKNLKHYHRESNRLIPTQFYFSSRIRRHNAYHIIIAVDESGSMLDSVIYSAVMAGIFSRLSMLRTDLIIFDTSVVDLTDYVQDPVEVLMNIQLGGGTHISKALDYVLGKITMPQKTIVVLVSDLYDGYAYNLMYKRVHDIIETGANLFVLTALDYEGNGSYDRNAAQHMANLGAQVAAITPKELANWIAKIVL